MMLYQMTTWGSRSSTENHHLLQFLTCAYVRIELCLCVSKCQMFFHSHSEIIVNYSHCHELLFHINPCKWPVVLWPRMMSYCVVPILPPHLGHIQWWQLLLSSVPGLSNLQVLTKSDVWFVTGKVPIQICLLCVLYMMGLVRLPHRQQYIRDEDLSWAPHTDFWASLSFHYWSMIQFSEHFFTWLHASERKSPNKSSYDERMMWLAVNWYSCGWVF